MDWNQFRYEVIGKMEARLAMRPTGMEPCGDEIAASNLLAKCVKEELQHFYDKFEAEVIWNLQNDQTQPEYVRKGARVLLDVLEEKENIKLRDYFNADRKVSSVRSEAIARTWIALLHSTEKKIPKVLPTAEEMDQEKQKSNKSRSQIIYYSTYTRLTLIDSCVSALALLDLPESNAELDAFFQRFEKRYGGSSGGQKMFKLYEMERSQAKEMVRLKNARWQEGPNPSAP